MKKFLLLVLLAALGGGGYYYYQDQLQRKEPDPRLTAFHQLAEDLVRMLQEYREYAGGYPAGDAASVAGALSGQADKKVIMLATSKLKKNAGGELLDPWGTPLQFFFSGRTVLIRSAGPDRIFEDSLEPRSDDLYRCEFNIEDSLSLK